MSLRYTQTDDPHDQIYYVLRTLSTFKSVPWILVLMTTGLVELLLNQLIRYRCKNHKIILKSNREYPLSVKTVLLHEAKVISDDLFNDLEWFRKLRNKAAHNPFFILDTDDLKRFKRRKFKNPYHFNLICVQLITDILLTDQEIFSKQFPKFKWNIQSPAYVKK
jgi:hypothetical protein